LEHSRQRYFRTRQNKSLINHCIQKKKGIITEPAFRGDERPVPQIRKEVGCVIFFCCSINKTAGRGKGSRK